LRRERQSLRATTFAARCWGTLTGKASSQRLPLVAEDYIGIRTILINGFEIISPPEINKFHIPGKSVKPHLPSFILYVHCYDLIRE